MALTDRYMLWSYVLVLMALGTALYIYRKQWIPILENVLPEGAYHRLRPSTFQDDLDAGLSSDSFSLAGNIESGDSRSGLDIASKKEVLNIMKRRGVNFDEARRIFTEQKFAKNGIGADGRPNDPRAVFFS
ncbi:hypothetical protein BDD12DRAFT_867623 [Trichophaea hybrida]|nr:hypothetical protein BDD12DRAFT_867623 [Trichophaea hybrida]